MKDIRILPKGLICCCWPSQANENNQPCPFIREIDIARDFETEEEYIFKYKCRHPDVYKEHPFGMEVKYEDLRSIPKGCPLLSVDEFSNGELPDKVQVLEHQLEEQINAYEWLIKNGKEQTDDYIAEICYEYEEEIKKLKEKLQEMEFKLIWHNRFPANLYHRVLIDKRTLKQKKLEDEYFPNRI
jgi:hypothetical protein